MKITGMILLLAFIGFNAAAQDVRLASVEYAAYSATKVENNSKNEVSASEFGAFLNIPVILKDKRTLFFTSLRYASVTPAIHFEDSAKTSKTLQKFALGLTVIHKWNNKFTITLNLTPTLASDFAGRLSGDDFLMQGSALFSDKFSNTITAGAGLAYTTQFGNPRLLPVLQFQYRQNRQSLIAVLPSFINYFYSITANDKLRIGARFGPNGGNYNISGNDFSTPAALSQFQYTRINIGPVINYQLAKYIQAEAFGGLSARRRYRFEDVYKTEYDFDARSGPFFNIGIVLNAAKVKDE